MNDPTGSSASKRIIVLGDEETASAFKCCLLNNCKSTEIIQLCTQFTYGEIQIYFFNFDNSKFSWRISLLSKYTRFLAGYFNDNWTEMVPKIRR